MTQPKLGERVLLVPQAHEYLMNPHRLDVNAIGQPPLAVTPVAGDRALDASRGRLGVLPSWETFTSTLVRQGYGVMVVRDSKLEVGPAYWDSGD